MSIREHFNKDSLHHAYLIEGIREEIEPEIFGVLEELNFQTTGNPDFIQISLDNFKIDDALLLRSMSQERGFGEGKKIFLISANSFTFDSHGVLLKMFEEPIPNTHFFLIIPSADTLPKTVLSRFYHVKMNGGLSVEIKEAEKFITLSLRERIDFLKEFLVEAKSANGGSPDASEEAFREEEMQLESLRSRAIKFVNALEIVLHNKTFLKSNFDNGVDFFEQILNVRQYLRQQGSSIKTLLESLALSIPKL